MLLIKPEVMKRLREAQDISVVQDMLISAFTLELATLPTYFTGAFSVKAGANQEAWALVQSVALEEMLHLTLACNLLISIGGNPEILKTGLGLKFPTQLPMNVDEGLSVSLQALTKEHIYQVFMGIERPDTRTPLPGETALHRLTTLKIEKGYNSIGDFYEAILLKLAEFQVAGDDPFAHPREERQVNILKWFPPTNRKCGNGKVTNLASAKAVIHTIVSQGEGVTVEKTPIDPYGGLEGSFAHFFKFGEIFYGNRLVENALAPSGWSYSGAPVALDQQGIHNFLPNAALSDYAPGSGAYVAGADFYNVYKRLLTSLDHVFNGAPDQLNAALGIMYELKLVAQKVVQYPANPSDPDGLVAAPPFMLTHCEPA
ncbi:MAG: ferritin-like protein [Sulfuricellaceae bacterium]